MLDVLLKSFDPTLGNLPTEARIFFSLLKPELEICQIQFAAHDFEVLDRV